jgi:hypothetical protein
LFHRRLVGIEDDLTKILSCFLVVEHCGYFRPRGQAP